MAAGTSIETLRKDSSLQLREAREELGEEILHVREDLNPRHLAQITIGRHKTAFILGGLAVGAVVSYCLFRPRRPVHPPMVQTEGPIPAPEATLTGKIVGGLVKMAAPFLIKALIAELTASRPAPRWIPETSEAERGPIDLRAPEYHAHLHD